MLGGFIAIESGILALMLELDGKKGSRPGEIPNMFLKRYAEWVSKYLVLISTNLSINLPCQLNGRSQKLSRPTNLANTH